MACVTRDSSPISNRSLTQRRRAVVCRHNHHASTSFSQAPFLVSASSFRPRFSPNSSTRPSKLVSPLTLDTGFRRFRVQRLGPRQYRQDCGGVAGQQRRDGQLEAKQEPVSVLASSKSKFSLLTLNRRWPQGVARRVPRTIEPARALAAETLALERTPSDLVNQAYALTSAQIELMWKTAPRPERPSRGLSMPRECRSKVNPRAAW